MYYGTRTVSSKLSDRRKFPSLSSSFFHFYSQVIQLSSSLSYSFDSYSLELLFSIYLFKTHKLTIMQSQLFFKVLFAHKGLIQLTRHADSSFNCKGSAICYGNFKLYRIIAYRIFVCIKCTAFFSKYEQHQLLWRKTRQENY